MSEVEQMGRYLISNFHVIFILNILIYISMMIVGISQDGRLNI